MAIGNPAQLISINFDLENLHPKNLNLKTFDVKSLDLKNVHLKIQIPKMFANVVIEIFLF